MFSSSSTLMVTAVCTFRLIYPGPAGGQGSSPVAPLLLCLTGRGGGPGRRVCVRGQGAELGLDVVGERVREPVEDGDGLAPGRPGAGRVALGQQGVAQAGQ